MKHNKSKNIEHITLYNSSRQGAKTNSCNLPAGRQVCALIRVMRQFSAPLFPNETTEIMVLCTMLSMAYRPSGSSIHASSCSLSLSGIFSWLLFH
jgi:hypothetical protein